MVGGSRSISGFTNRPKARRPFSVDPSVLISQLVNFVSYTQVSFFLTIFTVTGYGSSMVRIRFLPNVSVRLLNMLSQSLSQSHSSAILHSVILPILRFPIRGQNISPNLSCRPVYCLQLTPIAKTNCRIIEQSLTLKA